MTNTTQQNNEADRAQRLRKGDLTVMEELFTIYADRLYSLIFHQVNRDQALAEDITQETFLSALKSAKNFRGKSKLYTWLVSIAHHKIADQYRRQKRDRKYGKESFSAIDPEEIPDIKIPLHHVIESQEARIVCECQAKIHPV